MSPPGQGPAREAPALLAAMFEAAVAAARPSVCLPAHLPEPPRGRLLVLGAGKASAEMARVVEAHWPTPLEGLIVTRYGHAVPTRGIEVREAAHPVPDAAGEAAAQEILERARALGEDDLMLCLISGGGSALLSLPAPGLDLADKQAVNQALLESGAPIDAMNCLRKHLSAIKGGRLAAAAAPARVLCLMISDVPGDDPAVIASGPTVPDPTTFADARAVLERYGIAPPAAVARHLADAAEETPKPGDPLFERVENRIVTAPAVALDAAAGVAREAGLAVRLLGDALEGEARDLGRAHADLARQALAAGRPTVLLSGGETTVTMTGESGRGGRNSEYLLALAEALDGHPGIWAIACDTDGMDGSEDNAGARIAPDTLARARAAGRDPARDLAGHDAYSLFEATGDLIVTGPTLTNVNDFRCVLVDPRAGGH